jgi:hypothetical protein
VTALSHELARLIGPFHPTVSIISSNSGSPPARTGQIGTKVTGRSRRNQRDRVEIY